MKELFKLLEENTSEKGSFTLLFNDFKTYYKTAKEEYEDYDKDDLKNIDLNKDIYHLIWFKDTPVGNYDILGNNLEQVYDKVLKIINEVKKLRQMPWS